MGTAPFLEGVMNRREFVKRAAAALPICVDGLRISALARPPLLAALAGPSAALDRVLVIVQLSGGNDGLNTVIPLDQYATYQNLRPNIAIPESRVLRLTDRTGIHSAMTGMKALFDAGQLCVVQGVSYPNPNFSHFRATDIWLTASDYDQNLSSGWMGRYLNYDFPGYPSGYPNATMPDPPAIQIGSVVSIGFQGTSQSMAITIQDPGTFYQLVSGSSLRGQEGTPQTTAGLELSFIREVAAQSIGYAGRVKAAADRALNKSTGYPSAGQNSLADQLKIVARLIAGGLKTRVYLVSLGGFDTHSGQVVASDTTTGAHNLLLGKLSSAISVFLEDLALLGCDHRVVGMTFSEFGRRAASNASLGTDHGTAEPVFVFGRMVKGGVVGANSNLSDLTGGNLKMQFDFRTLYAAVLSHWFYADPMELDSVMLNSFAPLDLFQTPVLLPRRRPFAIDPASGLIEY
jgi:uncharacterized protein (DUF1501 family)